MRITLFIIVLLVLTVLWNSSPLPEDPPWGVFKMPQTAQACRASNGVWKEAYTATHPNPFQIGSDSLPAYCEIAYADSGSTCTTAKGCTSRVCVIHPVTRKGHCLGLLPPKGRFEFFDSIGNERSADLPF